jgi:SAM-dependent methyltransferase
MDKKEIIRYKVISRILDKLKVKRVGDFASGSQVLRDFVPKEIEYHSYDYPQYNLEEKFKIRENLDCAISSEVIEHLRNPRNFLDSLSNSMKNNSILILSTPNSTFIKNRLELLFGKTPRTFFGPAYKDALFSNEYPKLPKDKKLEKDFGLHVRAYNYNELKRILELSGFRIIKRIKLKYPGLRGKILFLFPLNFQGSHLIISKLVK